MAIYVRQRGARVILAILLVLALVAAFLAIQVFVLHSPKWG
jgi:hypothetical protein